VAFDVYKHVVGGYFYRLAAGLHAQWHMGSWIGRVARYMVGADTESLAKYGGIEGRKERSRMGRRAALRGLLPRVLPTYLPWYTPAKIEFTEEMRALASRYTEMATRVS
jgi:predicted metal-dependent hydrolase